ncbi:MAG: bifunctional phosphoribosylaminoimidazolecarboxamide formyltransferase/IMP cyclohydrolase, partial [Bacteroidota bacterium]
EKIDIGGIALILAAAKNYKDVIVVPSKDEYSHVLDLLNEGEGFSNMDQRKFFARRAYMVSSHYDTAIFQYFNRGGEEMGFKHSIMETRTLRYGENPHQQGIFHGDLEALFDKHHGKALSYNNLVDVDAAVGLMREFKDDAPTFAILKHTNACGTATRPTILGAWTDALAADPVSAFGGILIANTNIDLETAEEVNKLFCEVVIAPSFDGQALELLKSKKNRILLILKDFEMPATIVRSCLNGALVQDRDNITDSADALESRTTKLANEKEIEDLLFASKICKHTKSNTIVLAKGKQLCASGTGQTSRVDALNQAIHKAQSFNFDLDGAVMASDAFFPFPDCVEIANKAGITAVIQPGGSIKDQLSIDYCDANDMAMVFTGTRHFKH